MPTANTDNTRNEINKWRKIGKIIWNKIKRPNKFSSFNISDDKDQLGKYSFFTLLSQSSACQSSSCSTCWIHFVVAFLLNSQSGTLNCMAFSWNFSFGGLKGLNWLFFLAIDISPSPPNDYNQNLENIATFLTIFLTFLGDLFFMHKLFLNNIHDVFILC